MPLCKNCNKEFDIVGNRKTFCTKKCKVSFFIVNDSKKTSIRTSKRRSDKNKLIKEFGGKCTICEYDLFISALEFHHLDPSEKEDTINSYTSYEDMKKEAQKCILLCANCHRLIHNSSYDIALLKQNKTVDKEMTADIKQYMKDFYASLNKEEVVNRILEENKLLKETVGKCNNKKNKIN